MSLIPSESHSFPEPLAANIKPVRRLADRSRPSVPSPKRENVRSPSILAPKKPSANNRVSKVAPRNGRVQRVIPPRPARLPEASVVRQKPSGESWIDSSGELSQILQRKRSKLVRFVLFESVALVILLFLAKLGMSHPFPGDPLRSWFRVLTIAAVLPVGAIPILFYGLPPSVPRNRR
jgi:hypothetical protein